MKKLVVVAAAFAVVLPASAFACINGMKMELLERRENLVASASKAYRDGNFASAATLAERGLANPANDGEKRSLLRTLGLSNLRLGRFDKSADAFGKLAKEKKEPFIEAKLAEAQLRGADAAGQTNDEAKATLDRLMADGLLSDPDALVALARARVKAGDVAGARAACERALTIQPDHAEGKTLLGTLAPKSPEAAKAPAKS